MFQFQSGSIISVKNEPSLLHLNKFQFQSGSIISHNIFSDASFEKCFNSNLVQL